MQRYWHSIITPDGKVYLTYATEKELDKERPFLGVTGVKNLSEAKKQFNKDLAFVEKYKAKFPYKKNPSGKGEYSMHLRSVGNPDHGQYAPVSDPKTVHAVSLERLKRKAHLYIERWNLGGGNWVEPIVKLNGKPIGRFSYNLRFWSSQ
jgi:hypothetical protein